jgi:hypothetical protein
LNDTLLLSLLHSQLLPNYTARWLAIVKQKWSASVVGKRNGKLNSDLTGVSYKKGQQESVIQNILINRTSGATHVGGHISSEPCWKELGDATQTKMARNRKAEMVS